MVREREGGRGGGKEGGTEGRTEGRTDGGKDGRKDRGREGGRVREGRLQGSINILTNERDKTKHIHPACAGVLQEQAVEWIMA